MTARKLVISCMDREWAKLRAQAKARNRSASRYAIDRALEADPPPRAQADDPERLVLNADQQRALLAAVGRIDEGLRADSPRAATLNRLGELVALAMEAWIRAGHGERLLAIAEELVGDERMPAVRAWVRERERAGRA